jgi:hypothetical protein
MFFYLLVPHFSWLFNLSLWPPDMDGILSQCYRDFTTIFHASLSAATCLSSLKAVFGACRQLLFFPSCFNITLCFNIFTESSPKLFGPRKQEFVKADKATSKKRRARQCKPSKQDPTFKQTD